MYVRCSVTLALSLLGCGHDPPAETDAGAKVVTVGPDGAATISLPDGSVVSACAPILPAFDAAFLLVDSSANDGGAMIDEGDSPDDEATVDEGDSPDDEATVDEGGSSHGEAADANLPDAGEDAPTLADASATYTGSVDASHATIYPAPHPPAPQIVSLGGPVLAAPRFSAVFFPTDDPALQTQLTSFLGSIGASDYWAATTGPYGVGTATLASTILAPVAPPALVADSDIQQLLTTALNTADPNYPVPDDNAVFVFFYPSGVTVTDSNGESSCSDFQSYHASAQLDAAHSNRNVAYVVVPSCPAQSSSTLDLVTSSTAHELIEAATDPYVEVDPAYAGPDVANEVWSLAFGGGELADMCSQLGLLTKPQGFNFAVPPIWSNFAAAAGLDPCIPSLDCVPYFNSAVVLPDILNPKTGTPGVLIRSGQTRTVELDLFSQGDTGGPWDVDVVDLSTKTTGSGQLAFSLDRSQGSNVSVRCSKPGRRGVLPAGGLRPCPRSSRWQPAHEPGYTARTRGGGERPDGACDRSGRAAR